MASQSRIFAREEFVSFWRFVLGGGLNRRAWVRCLLVSLPILPVAVLIHKLGWGQVPYITEVLMVLWLGSLFLVRKFIFTAHERQFLSCPACLQKIKSDDLKTVVTTSSCSKCGETILA